MVGVVEPRPGRRRLERDVIEREPYTAVREGD
jgi:hypothetical protein